MNNIIYITGAPRCGKTTLANQLKREQISVLSLDAFSKSIRSVFADFKLYSNRVCIQPDINRDKFLELIYKYSVNFFEDYPKYTLVIEGCHFTPNEFIARFPNAKIICLGRTKSIGDIKDAIMTKDWMSKLSDEKTNEYAQMIYDYSKTYYNSCGKYLYLETDEIDMKLIEKYLFADYESE